MSCVAGSMPGRTWWSLTCVSPTRSRAAIPGSVNIPLGEVVDRMGELDAARPTAVICAGGVRSVKAVKALTAAGYTGELVNVSGGMKAWLGQ